MFYTFRWAYMDTNGEMHSCWDDFYCATMEDVRRQYVTLVHEMQEAGFTNIKVTYRESLDQDLI